MYSLLHDFHLYVRSARYDLFLAWLAFGAFTIGGCTAARGGEEEARAALALAKAKRERETTSCFVEYEAAAAAARRTNKPLVLWVGVKCSEHSQLRRELEDAVHCHLAEQRLDKTPRVVIQGADGVEWFVRAEKIGPDTLRKIREKWEAPRVPLLRPDVGISEELGCIGPFCPLRNE